MGMAVSIGVACPATAAVLNGDVNCTVELTSPSVHIVETIHDIDDECCAEVKSVSADVRRLPPCAIGKTFTSVGSLFGGSCDGPACVRPYPVQDRFENVT